MDYHYGHIIKLLIEKHGWVKVPLYQSTKN